MSAAVSSRAPIAAEAEEPFGQIGMRRYIKPALIAMVAVAALVSVACWYRSNVLVDGVTASPVDGASWSIASIYGRIVITRVSAAQNEVRGPIQWSYRTYPLQPIVNDGWQPSILKMIGIEWRHARLNPMVPSTPKDFWLRIRWRTVAMVLWIVPIVHIIGERFRRRAERLATASDETRATVSSR